MEAGARSRSEPFTRPPARPAPPGFARRPTSALPANALPRKDDAIAGRPEKLLRCLQRVEHTARPVVGLPDLPPGAVGDSGHTNGPGRSRAVGAAADLAASGELSHE